MLKNEINNFAKFANKLADISEKIVMKYFRKEFIVKKKIDGSPVTIADIKCEKKIREMISKKFPSHNILGEEYKEKNNKNKYTWVIDPIDGTRSYISGHKDFGTLIALLKNNEPIIGIINCPAHKERWVGLKDQPTKLNNKIISTSKKKLISKSYAYSSGLYFDNQKFRKGFEKVTKKSAYYRMGGDCYMYGMLASGLIDIVIEDTLKVHDYMALIPVIQGAGGVISDKNNKSIKIDSDGSLVASANKNIHKQVIEILKNI
ncbi:MAG: Histidinol-phosphatase [Alphaproteobacteria bacterium MarineAlpha5_Bin9]|nr:MAG: Histidinol-phosphatase [Alphaproteobacteria bacterium MarineAlpha5_Bin9]|tara:strand:- start:7242 stop:8024 length:783 start_codon:yes stop_codon:yes gene_type:complete